MLERLFGSIFDEEHEFAEIWELKLIKFDTDLDENLKPYEHYISISSNVEDTKGNPNMKGSFYLSNLRVIWHSIQDKNLNLSIGIDTITHVFVKAVPSQGTSNLKYTLLLKTISPSQTKYEFKFTGYTEKEEALFNLIGQTYKEAIATKYLRAVDANLRLVNMEFQPIEYEELKSKYDSCSLYQNGNKRVVTLILTNVRVIFIAPSQAALSYAIPWIMIQSFAKTKFMEGEVIQLRIRGHLSNTEIFLTSDRKPDFIKISKQMTSFSQTYNKNPILGIKFDLSNSKNLKEKKNFISSEEFTEIQNTKVNLGRKKNAYGDGNSLGDIKNTQFNQELGIMMEKLPEGFSREDLWQILRD